jgi:multidrug efflux pump subunit AcrA (membrane-fusion protein)
LRSLWDWLAANGKSRWTMREKRAQIIYGAASFVFSTTLLVYVYSRLFTWVTTKYQLAGLVVFGVFANFTLRKAMVEPIEGVKAVATRVSMKRYRNIGIALSAVILSVVVKINLKVTADPTTIFPTAVYPVNAPTEGLIQDIPVRNGSVVHQGEKLAVLTDFVKQDKLDDTIGRLKEQTRNLEGLRRGTRPEDIEEEKRTINRLKVEHDVVFKNEGQKNQLLQLRASRSTELKKAEGIRDNYKTLYDKGLTAKILADGSQSDVEIADSRVKEIDREILVIDEKAANRAEELNAQIREHEIHLQRLMNGNTQDQILQVEEDVKRLQATVDRYTKELKKTVIFAPYDGVITTPRVEELVGQYRSSGAEIMQLVVTSKIRAELMVPELEYEAVQQGNDVSVRVKSFPSKEFWGRIDWIAPAVHNVNGEPMIEMHVYLDNKDDLLKPGMMGYSKIYCGKKRIIELVTRRVGRWIKFDLPKLW